MVGGQEKCKWGGYAQELILKACKP